MITVNNPNTKATVFTFDSTPNDSHIPEYLVTLTWDAVFETWQTIETELSCVDPHRDPTTYQALDDVAAALFESRTRFRYIERRC
jgi:hypothetical protein